MSVSSSCLSEVAPETKLDKCCSASESIKLTTKTSKLFSIESIIANKTTSKSPPGDSSSSSPVRQESFYPGGDYPLPHAALLPPGAHHHYGNMLYNNAWFGGLFNAQFSANNSHPEKDLTGFAGFPPPQPQTLNDGPRVPLIFNDPGVINAYQREKLAQYFMNSLRSAGGGGGGGPGGDCDKLTELIFRGGGGGYPAMHPVFDGFSDQQSDKSRSPFQEQNHHQQQLPSQLNGPSGGGGSPEQQQHLSSGIMGCLPSLMSKQIQGGAAAEINQQQGSLHQERQFHGDKGMMMDTASNDSNSISDDLSLTLSPGESNKHRGEKIMTKSKET